MPEIALSFFEAEAKARRGGDRRSEKAKSSGPIGPDEPAHRARDDAAATFATTPRTVQLTQDRGVGVDRHQRAAAAAACGSPEGKTGSRRSVRQARDTRGRIPQPASSADTPNKPAS